MHTLCNMQLKVLGLRIAERPQGHLVVSLNFRDRSEKNEQI